MTDSRHPIPVSPRNGDAVQFGAATFEWESFGGSLNHHVQISASERFENLLVDTLVGHSTSLTLMSVLPQDGRKLYWRVGAHKGAWSEPAWFLASEPRRAAATARSATRPAASSARAAAMALPADAPLYMTGTTGNRELTGSIIVLVVLVVFLVAVLGF